MLIIKVFHKYSDISEKRVSLKAIEAKEVHKNLYEKKTGQQATRFKLAHRSRLKENLTGFNADIVDFNFIPSEEEIRIATATVKAKSGTVTTFGE